MSSHTTYIGERIILRSSLPQDVSFLVRVYASTRADEMALVNWTQEQKEAFVRMQFEAQLKDYKRNYPHAQYQVIEQAGQPIGRMIVDRSDDPILLMDIALLPEYRNAGIGTGLIRDLMSEAERTNRAIRLHVEIFNPAMRLYSRLGFVKSDQIGIYHEMTWRSKVS